MVALTTPPALVVLAGGLGTRMLHHTRDTPKALLPVGDTTFLALLLRTFADSGVTDVLLCTGHLSARIREEIGDGRALGLRVTHSPEPEPLGPIGALRHARCLLPEAFLLTYCDVLPTIETRWFVGRARACGRPAAMATGTAPTPSEANTLVVDGAVTAYGKRPAPPGATWCDRGLLALEASVLDRHPGTDEETFYGALATAGDLAAVPVRDPVVDIGTARRYENFLRRAETT